jgi:hypothetical protein
MGIFGFARENEFDSLIWSHGQAANVDPLLIKAIIAQESGFNPQAQRAEPRLNDASRGLMQILYATARGLGYSGSPDGLFDPDTNLTYGTAYLSQQLMRYGGDMLSAAAGYNAGTARKNPDGTFVNQAYVDGVERYYLGYVNAEAQSPPTAGGTVADILRDQPAQPPPPDGGGAFERIWTDVTGLFSLSPTTSPAPAPDDTSPLNPGTTAAIASSGEGDLTWLLAGAAVLGLAIFALDGGT